MPWPISPAPTTAIRGFAITKSARRVPAVRIEDMAGVEIRRLGGEEEKRAGEIGRLSKPALGNARDESLAHGGRALVVFVHPGGERGPEHGRRNGIDGYSRIAPLTAQRLGDAVDGRFRGAIGGVTRRVAEQAARRRHEYDLA